MKKTLKFIHITKTGGTSIENTGKLINQNWGRFHKNEIGYWHKIFEKYPNKIKSKYDWFTVVRNPYNRILSEYYCKWGGIGNENIDHNIDEFNKYLINKVKNCRYLKHYTKQFKYIPDNKNIKIRILKFENLKEEFKKLLKEYNLPDIELLHENKAKNKKFTINDFNDELINTINKVYDKDFKMFGYKKIIK